MIREYIGYSHEENHRKHLGNMQLSACFPAIFMVMNMVSVLRVSAEVDYSQYVNPFIGGSGPFEGQACVSFPKRIPPPPK